ncbi:MAG: zf-TFIIB domain-containing protein [Deltaproteobacteria bacterium]|nr:zf-TFIIB domain-containing protein [Deltaproteobacteria bacterium]MBW2042260.1 zf-TFIIB domain-containing protein [Deltaproteobacteria bacterium]
MQCPLCTIELNMTSRQGIEIDYCPKCRGIWLDRGELDKLADCSLKPHPDFDNSSGWDKGLKKQSKNSLFHSSSHHERRLKYGKLKSLLQEIPD